MNDDYKRLRQIADKLYYRFNDVVDDRNAASGIASSVRDIVECFEMNKQPRSIDDRVKHAIEALKELKHGDGAAMDFSDVDGLIDSYEELREEIRELDNY